MFEKWPNVLRHARNSTQELFSVPRTHFQDNTEIKLNKDIKLNKYKQTNPIALHTDRSWTTNRSLYYALYVQGLWVYVRFSSEEITFKPRIVAES